MSVSTRIKLPKRRRSNDGRYTRCIAIQKHPINLLIERFVKLLDATYAERLRKLGLYIGQELRKRRTEEMQQHYSQVYSSEVVMEMQTLGMAMLSDVQEFVESCKKITSFFYRNCLSLENHFL